MTDEQESALRDFAAASKRLGQVSGKNASGAEAAYGAAYQRLVKLGVKSQIRHKYRVPKR